MNSCNVNYQRQEINLQKMAGESFAITFKIDQQVAVGRRSRVKMVNTVFKFV